MYTISKRFTFSASHQLPTLPEDHQCRRLHGHNYEVEVELTGTELDEHGFVLDYGELAPVRRLVDELLDHRHLNDVLDVTPSAEHLAHWLFERCKESLPNPGSLTAVRVSETPRTWAEYRP